jgi:hypothetical protein
MITSYPNWAALQTNIPQEYRHSTIKIYKMDIFEPTGMHSDQNIQTHGLKSNQ